MTDLDLDHRTPDQLLALAAAVLGEEGPAVTLCPPRRLPRCTLPGGHCMIWHRRGDSVLWTAQIRPGKALPVRPYGWLPDDGAPCRRRGTTCEVIP